MVLELHNKKDLWKNKILQSTQDEDERNWSSGWNRLLSYQDVMEFNPRWRLLKYVSNSYLILINFLSRIFYRIIHSCYIIVILGFLIE